MQKTPCVLYGKEFASKADAMRYFEINDYQSMKYHMRRSNAGLPYEPVAKIKKQTDKRKRIAAKLEALGFTDWKKG